MTPSHPQDSASQPAPFTQEQQGEIESLQADLERRQIHPRGPARARELVNQLMASRGYNQRRSNQQREQTWNEAVGDLIASQSRAVRLSRGVLTVMVKNSAVMQELVFMQDQLVKKINGLQPALQVKSLRFRVGSI